MVRVAVAGGTGGVGRHIVEAVLAAKKHTVVVLSRSSSQTLNNAPSADIVTVDYNNPASLVKALQGIALLHAAVEAGVKRFAPSEWSIASVPNDPITLCRPKVKVVEVVAKSGLEWTVFENGLFTNYFVSGTKGVGYLEHLKSVVDVENCTARVPGTGNQKVYFTRVEDVAAFAVASLDLPKWPERSGMVGEALSYNEVIALAEKVRGRKFEVTYVSEDQLHKQLLQNPPSPWDNFFVQVYIEVIHGRFMYEVNLNILCPQVKTMGVEELMRKWWI